MKASNKVFQILDLDRTLLDTEKLAHNLKEIINRHEPELSKAIDKEIIRHAKDHTSFFIFEYIADHVGHEKLKDYTRELNYTAPSSELLLPGAMERIEFAKSQPNWSVGILTYGSKRDQMIKLRLVDLQLERHLITEQPEKGEMIATWLQPDGTFKLPLEFGGHIVDTLTLDDDKLLSFKDLPHNVHGQWITHAFLGGANELQKLPDNIKMVRNLEDSIEYLKTKLSLT